MNKFKYFIKYLGLDAQWHKVRIGKNAKVEYILDVDQETGKTITVIKKGAQTFKAVIYTFVKEPE